MNNATLQTALESTRRRLIELSRHPDLSPASLAGVFADLAAALNDAQAIEVELHTSEVRYRTLFDQASDAIFLENECDEIIDVNQRACELLGYTREELLQLTVADLQAPEVRRPGGHVVAEEWSRYRGATFESINVRRDGTHVPVEVSQSHLTGQDEKLILTIVRDITARKQAEQALRESEEKYRQLFELESDAIFLIDNENGRIMEANPSAVALYGYSRDELLQMHNTDLSAEPDRVQPALKDGLHVVPIRWHRARDGRIFPVEITARYFAWQGRAAHISAIRDVTERMRAEQALRESEQRYRALVETSPDAIVLTTPTGQVMLCNQRAAEMLGVADRNELIGQSVIDFVALAEREQARINFMRTLVEGTRRDTEYLAVRRDGTEFPVEVSASAIYDADRQPVALVALVRDITDRKQAATLLQQRHHDLTVLNDELRVRNEELDAFAHTVAHDLKNPLHLIIGFGETLRTGWLLLSDAERDDVLNRVARSARKMNNIIDELLLLAEVRKVNVQPSPLDLTPILAAAQQRLIDVIVDNAAVIAAPATWPTVLGHAPWVEEVWVNYLSNALKYGGRPPHVELGYHVQADGMARLWVHDNGNGVSPDEQTRLFVPFTRLEQARAHGHGLGLSIVRRIVEKMGGQVGVVSTGRPGQGSEFFFTLPVAR